MFGNLLAWLLIVLIMVGFGWLTRRAWGSTNVIVKWGGSVLAGLLTLVFALVSVLSGIGLYQFYAPRGGAIPNIQSTTTPEQVARGKHLAETLCAHCHSQNGELPLSGGVDIGKDSPLPIGSYFSINLTPGGPLKNWSDGEIMRVFTDGVDRDGRPLLVMSANGVRELSDDDKRAMIAYLRSQPPVVNPTPDPPDQPNLLIAIMVGGGVFKFQPPLSGPVTAPPKAASVEYGKYIVRYQECTICHGDDLAGGANPIAPPGPSLRVVQGWTLDQFATTLRTGKDPSGHSLSEAMPWRDFGRMDDQEFGALYAYLKSLPPVQK